MGAEPIRRDLLATFADRFARCGFSPTSFVASYGLAEATLAVTMGQPGGGRDVLAREAAISCGSPVGQTAVEIRRESGGACEEREIGRVFVSGGGVGSGYLAAGGVEPFSEDGWLDTGDMGSLGDGQLVVVGRTDELIFINGRNVWPDDIEACARDTIGESGLVGAAFGSTGRGGRQASTLIIEHANPARAAEERGATVAGAITAELAIECDVRFVGRRALPRTSSGKISRAAAKAAYLEGRLAPR